jgi:hypothetical protein
LKKILAIIFVAMMVAVFAGCQKQEAPKPTEEASAPTATMTAPAAPAAPAAAPAAPEHK